MFLFILSAVSGTGTQKEINGSGGFNRGTGQALVETALREDGTVSGENTGIFLTPVCLT